jgi:hypothetical protein
VCCSRAPCHARSSRSTAQARVSNPEKKRHQPTREREHRIPRGLPSGRAWLSRPEAHPRISILLRASLYRKHLAAQFGAWRAKDDRLYWPASLVGLFSILLSATPGNVRNFVALDHAGRIDAQASDVMTMVPLARHSYFLPYYLFGLWLSGAFDRIIWLGRSAADAVCLTVVAYVSDAGVLRSARQRR